LCIMTHSIRAKRRDSVYMEQQILNNDRVAYFKGI